MGIIVLRIRLKSELPVPVDKASAEIFFIYEAFYSGAIASFRSWTKYSEFLSSAELVTLFSHSFFTGLESETGQNVIQSLKKIADQEKETTLG
ncbi:hypothetical protein [Enterococcus avium]|uniref:hypothetical protein n=1 Tax=Enterococcus avium TaxID=33945 RepID=UPI0037A40455